MQIISTSIMSLIFNQVTGWTCPALHKPIEMQPSSLPSNFLNTVLSEIEIPDYIQFPPLMVILFANCEID